MRLFGILLIGSTVTLTLLACKACRNPSPEPPAFPPPLARGAPPSPTMGEPTATVPVSTAGGAGVRTPFDVTPTPVPAIPPGTAIPDDGPPRGWSHLVVKSKPRVRPAEVGKVNRLTARMASWMMTTFLADVRPTDDGTFVLNAYALGVGAKDDKGTDRVVTADTAGRFGVDTGLLGGTLLEAAADRQKADSKTLARSPTMAVLDTPVWFRTADGTNKLLRFRYALLVDPTTGKLDVVIWGVDPDGKGRGPDAVGLIAPATIDPAELVPDKGEFTFGVPSEAGFGVDKLPPHKPLKAFPEGLDAIARGPKFTAASAAELEAGLRVMLGN